MPLNSYLTLGRSGLRVSPFCLGAMTLGEDLGGGFGASVTDSEAMLSHHPWYCRKSVEVIAHVRTSRGSRRQADRVLIHVDPSSRVAAFSPLRHP